MLLWGLQVVSSHHDLHPTRLIFFNPAAEKKIEGFPACSSLSEAQMPTKGEDGSLVILTHLPPPRPQLRRYYVYCFMFLRPWSPRAHRF